MISLKLRKFTYETNWFRDKTTKNSKKAIVNNVNNKSYAIKKGYSSVIAHSLDRIPPSPFSISKDSGTCGFGSKVTLESSIKAF